MSNLITGHHFSFFGEKTVYCVEKINYVGNRAGDFSVHYYNITSNADFIWKSTQYNSKITIYNN